MEDYNVHNTKFVRMMIWISKAMVLCLKPLATVFAILILLLVMLIDVVRETIKTWAPAVVGLAILGALGYFIYRILTL